MTLDVPRLIMLEDVTDPDDPATVEDAFPLDPPVRTLRDRQGNHFVLLSVAHYVRLLSERSAVRGQLSGVRRSCPRCGERSTVSPSIPSRCEP